MNKYPTNVKASPGTQIRFEDLDRPEIDEDGRDTTPTRITFYLPVTIQGTADWRIDVPAYLLGRPEAELIAYIRENMHDDGYERNVDQDDYSYDYSGITIS